MKKKRHTHVFVKESIGGVRFVDGGIEDTLRERLVCVVKGCKRVIYDDTIVKKRVIPF